MSKFNIKHTAIAAIIATAGLTGAAQAESFNERGDYFPNTVQVSSADKAQVVQAEISGFNERDEYFVNSVTVSDGAAKAMVQAEIQGFNQRGEYFVSTVRNQGYGKI